MNFFLLICLACPATALISYGTLGVLSKKLAKLIFLLIFGSILIAFYGLRSTQGISVDYGNYWFNYSSFSHISWVDALSPFNVSTKGQIGFSIINKVVGEFTHYNVLDLMLVLGLLIVFFSLLYFSRKSDHVVLCVFLLLTIGSFWSSFNTIRQFLAGVIYCFSLTYARKKKFFPYFLIVLLAASIHWSAIFMLPFYFFYRIQWNLKQSWLLLVVKIFFLILLAFVAAFILSKIGTFNVLSDQYLVENTTSAANLLRPAFILLVPLWLIISGKTSISTSRLQSGLNTLIIYFILSVSSLNGSLFLRYTYFFVLPAIVFMVEVIFETSGFERWFYVGLVVFLALLYLYISTNSVPYTFYWQDPALVGMHFLNY